MKIRQPQTAKENRDETVTRLEKILADEPVSKAYFVTVDNDRVEIVDVGRNIEFEIKRVEDVEVFARTAEPGAELFKSSSLDHPGEYATSDNTIDLAEQVNNCYFRS